MDRVLGVAIATLLSFPGASLASQWVSVVNTEQTSNYVDIHSIRRNGSIAWYWTYTVYPEPDPYGVLSFTSYESTDCSQKIVRLRHYIEYDSNRRTTLEISPGNSGPLVRIDTKSSAEAIFNFVCSR